jgi:large subunit ribosomal protein L22
MEARASSKYLRGSAQKARLVVDMIRGKQVGDALAILQFTNKRAATPIEKCLRSAIANATEAAERGNIAVDPDDLWVKACFVDMGPTKNRRRVRPAPQGRAYREQRHFCHVTVLLSTEGKENGPAGKGTAGRGKKADSPAGKKGAKGEPKRTPAAKAAKGAGAEKKTTKEDASAKPEANAAATEETAQE